MVKEVKDLLGGNGSTSTAGVALTAVASTSNENSTVKGVKDLPGVNGSKSTAGVGLAPAATTSDENFKFNTLGVVVCIGIILLTLFVARRVRKNKRQQFSGVEYKSFVYDGQAPPPNVFSSSRKKEGEGEYDDESAMIFDIDNDCNYEDDVEMLDEAISRILESQFRR